MAPPKPYHPRVMRPATLAVLVALTLAMLALVEVSIRKLPAAISTTSDVQELRVSSSSSSSSSVTHRFSSATITNLRREAPVSSSLLPIPKTRATGLYPAYTKSENEDLVSFTLTSRIKRVIKTTVITHSYEAPARTRCQLDGGCSTTEIEAGLPPLDDLTLNPRAQDAEFPKFTTTRFGAVTVDEDSIVSNTEIDGAPSGGWLLVGTNTVKIDDLLEKGLKRSTITTQVEGVTKTIVITYSTTPSPGAPINGWLDTDQDGDADPGMYSLTATRYFLAAFAPILIAVIFSIPWTIVDTTMKRMEPFYRLSRLQGATATKSLCLTYSARVPGMRILDSGLPRDWELSLSAVLVLLSKALTALSPEAVRISLIGTCKANVSCDGGFLSVSRETARAVEAFLSAMALLTIILIVRQWNRPSAVYSEPFSLGGLWKLTNNPVILQDLSSISAEQLDADRHALAKSLDGPNVRYYITTYQDEHGNIHHGLFRQPNPYRPYPSFSAASFFPAFPPHHPFILEHILLALVILPTIAITVVYYIDSSDTAFERFMSGQGFGVRFLFTVIGILISGLWKKVFDKLVRIYPYLALTSNSNNLSPSSIDFEFKPPLSPFASLFAFQDWRITLVAANAVLAEILTIALANVPFSNATARTAYLACNFMAWGIMLIMLASAVVVLLIRAPRMPRAAVQSVAGGMWVLARMGIMEKGGGS